MEQENLVVKDSLTTKIIYKNNIINTQKIRLVIGSPFSSIEIFIVNPLHRGYFVVSLQKLLSVVAAFEQY